MNRLLTLTFIVVFSGGWAHAQVISHGDCTVDSEVWSLPACAFEKHNDKLFVSKAYLSLFFSSNGTAIQTSTSRNLAWTHMPTSGWAYFNRTGLVVVQNVATMDNGPNDFHHELVRVTKGKKWGLSDPQGRLVVPLQYDGMMDYEEGKGWLACSGCHTETDAGGEYYFFKGGKRVWLNSQGKVSGTANDPSLARGQKAQN
ncbi:MAG TPA: WG repeat-containing protein [Acidobacteriaceae bacterium]|jgi:hypothetical protein|nr:WG repeat-containing protein [Acidobacteriaceae bacterium]